MPYNQINEEYVKMTKEDIKKIFPLKTDEIDAAGNDYFAIYEFLADHFDGLSVKDKVIVAQKQRELIEHISGAEVVKQANPKKKWDWAFFKSGLVFTGFVVINLLSILVAAVEAGGSVGDLLAAFNPPALAIYLAIAGIALVGVMVYFAFNMRALSKEFGYSFMEGKSYIHDLIAQQEMLEKLILENPNDLDNLKGLKDKLDKAVDVFATEKEPKNSKTGFALRIFLSLLNGAIGFFSGKAFLLIVAVPLLNIAMPGAAVVTAIAAIFAFVYLASFYIIEGKAVDKFISKLSGFDHKQAMIDKLESNKQKLQLTFDLSHEKKKNVELKVENTTLKSVNAFSNMVLIPRSKATRHSAVNLLSKSFDKGVFKSSQIQPITAGTSLTLNK